MEKGVKTFVQVLSIAVALFFVGFGFFGHPGTDKFSQEFLYDALHPFTVLDFFGCVLFFACVVYASGFWSGLFGEQYLPAGSTWTNWAAFAAGVLGCILIFA